MDVYLNYNSTTTDQISPHINNLDIGGPLNPHGLVFTSYLYPEKGSYNICAVVKNNVSEYVEYFVHPVLNAIRGISYSL